MRLMFYILLFFLTCAQAKATELTCAAEDKLCLLSELSSLTEEIDERNWRDQTFRELAKLYTKELKSSEAIALIDKIEHADTKAMTIRGIGMTAATTDLSEEEFESLFTRLRQEADKIEHPPSYAIALTYIAMAQAFAGDDDGALATAKDMENDALRNKAFGESAEIQAENGRFDEAMTSISEISSPSFRDKAHRTISKIFADNSNYEDALESAQAIEATYPKAQAVLYILSKQITPEEVSLVK